jgi:hypothetical protein
MKQFVIKRSATSTSPEQEQGFEPKSSESDSQANERNHQANAIIELSRQSDSKPVIKMQHSTMDASHTSGSDQFVYRLTTITVGLINIFLIALVTIFYVIYVLKASYQHTILVQIFFSAFKVFWNEYVLWRLYPAIKFICTGLYQRMCGACVSHSSTNSSAGDSQSIWDKIHQYKFSIDEINFMVFIVLLNNIVIPCISIAVVSPHCYYNAFFAEEPQETIAIYSCQLYRLRRSHTRDLDNCLLYDSYEYQTTYNAPFHYRYECSAAFTMKFVAVYIFMFIIVGAVIPFTHIVLQLLYYKYEAYGTDDEVVQGQGPNPSPSPGKKSGPETSQESETMRRIYRWIFQVVDFFLPNRWKSLTAKPSSTTSAMKLLSNDRLIVKFSSYLAILLAFGVIFPPLALVALVSIYSITYFEQYSMAHVY